MRSGDQAELIDAYKEIMHEHGFSKHNVLRQNQGKTGREDCLYFSELVLRASKLNGDNGCAREYVTFVDDLRYFNKQNSHLISFVPQRCRGHICDIALDMLIEGLSASHIFIETGVQHQDDVYHINRGVIYRRD